MQHLRSDALRPRPLPAEGTEEPHVPTQLNMLHTHITHAHHGPARPRSTSREGQRCLCSSCRQLYPCLVARENDLFLQIWGHYPYSARPTPSLCAQCEVNGFFSPKPVLLASVPSTPFDRDDLARLGILFRNRPCQLSSQAGTQCQPVCIGAKGYLECC